MFTELLSVPVGSPLSARLPACLDVFLSKTFKNALLVVVHGKKGVSF